MTCENNDKTGENRKTGPKCKGWGHTVVIMHIPGHVSVMNA